MEQIKERHYKHSHIEICRNCGGTGKVVESGHDYGHGFSREQRVCTCDICKGEGRVLVEIEVNTKIIALTSDEWNGIKPGDNIGDGEWTTSDKPNRKRQFGLWNK